MKNKNLYDILAVSSILLIIIIVLHKVIYTKGLIMYGDLSFPIYLERFIDAYYPLWDPYISYPMGMERLYSIPFIAPFIFVAKILKLSSETFVKVLIITTLFLGGLSMYYASSTLLRETYNNNKIVFFASLASVLVYVFNPWSLERIGHFFLWTSYAFAPLILIFSMKMLESGTLNYKNTFVVAFLWFLTSTSPHSIIFSGIIVSSWILYSLLLLPMKEKIKIIFTNYILLLFLYMFLSSYWIVPLLITSNPEQPLGIATYTINYGGIEMLSRNSDIFNVIRLVDSWWPQVDYQPSSQSLNIMWLFASFILPFAAFAVPLLIHKNDKITNFLLIYLLLFIFLAMGTKSPYPLFYKLITDLPFLNQIGGFFRDPNKWNGLTALMYSFLIGILISELSQRISTKFTSFKVISLKNHVLLLTPFFLFFLLFIIYAGPTLSGYFNSIYVPTKIPQEYYDVNEWLKNQSGDFRVLWLAPWYAETRTVIKGTIRYSWAPDKAASNTIEVWSSAKPSISPHPLALSDNLISNINLLGVRYIIYHNDILGAEKEGMLEIERLMKQKNLKLVWNKNFMYVFENEDFAQRFFVPQYNILVYGNINTIYINTIFANSSAITFLKQDQYKVLRSKYIDTIIIDGSQQEVKRFLNESFKLNENMKTIYLLKEENLYVDSQSYYPYFLGIDKLLNNSGFELTDSNYPLVWTRTHWSGKHGTLKFFSGNTSFEGKHSAAIISNDSSNIAAYDYRTNRRASIIVNNKKNSTMVILFVSLYYKTSPDFKGSVFVNIYTEDASGKWLGDFKSPRFKNPQTDWKRIDLRVNLPKNTYSFSPEIFVENFKGEVFFDDFKISYKIINHDTSEIPLVLLNEKMELSSKIQVIKTSRYMVSILAKTNSENVTMSVYIDSKEIKIPLNKSTNKLNWASSQKFYMEAGTHNLKILSKDTVEIGAIIIIYPYDEKDVFTSKDHQNQTTITYKEIDPTKYIVHVNTTRPFTLIFTESYNPFWIGYSDDFFIRSTSIYPNINAFYINKTGNYDLIIEFEPQKYVYIGLIITILTILVSMILIIREREKKL